MEEMEATERKQPSIWKAAMNYGLITGIGIILVTVIFYIMGELANPWANYLGYAVLIIGIVLGIKNYRDNMNNGFITYGTALGTGTLVGLFAAIISSIFSILLFHVIDPAAMQQILVNAELKMIESMPDLTDEQLEAALKMSRTMMQPGLMFVFGVATYTFISFILSLIIAAIMKKNPTL